MSIASLLQPKVKTKAAAGNRGRATAKIKEPKGISREIIDDDSSDEEPSTTATTATKKHTPANQVSQ